MDGVTNKRQEQNGSFAEENDLQWCNVVDFAIQMKSKTYMLINAISETRSSDLSSLITNIGVRGILE